MKEDREFTENPNTELPSVMKMFDPLSFFKRNARDVQLNHQQT
jgi:hypothetical protein